MDYSRKYKKYKLKYLNLRSMLVGGGEGDLVKPIKQLPIPPIESRPTKQLPVPPIKPEKMVEQPPVLPPKIQIIAEPTQVPTKWVAVTPDVKKTVADWFYEENWLPNLPNGAKLETGIFKNIRSPTKITKNEYDILKSKSEKIILPPTDALTYIAYVANRFGQQKSDYISTFIQNYFDIANQRFNLKELKENNDNLNALFIEPLLKLKLIFNSYSDNTKKRLFNGVYTSALKYFDESVKRIYQAEDYDYIVEILNGTFINNQEVERIIKEQLTAPKLEKSKGWQRAEPIYKLVKG